MSEHKFIAGVLFFTFFEIMLFTMFATHNAYINCPQLPEYPANNTLGAVWTSLNLFVSPCSGLPYWVYILIFMPLLVALAGYLTPFIG